MADNYVTGKVDRSYPSPQGDWKSQPLDLTSIIRGARDFFDPLEKDSRLDPRAVVKLKQAAVQDVQDQGNQAVNTAVQTGNVDQSAVSVGLSDKAPEEHAQIVKQAAAPIVRKRVEEGSITKQDAVAHSVQAENNQRDAQGLPPMDAKETQAHASKVASMWDSLGIDGKTALVLGAAMAGAVAMKNSPTYNQNFLGAYQAALERKQQQAMLDARIKAETEAAKRDQQFRATQGDLNRKNAVDVANIQADSRLGAAELRYDASLRAIQDKIDKQSRLKPEEVDKVISDQLVGAGFNQFADSTHKQLDAKFAEAKGNLMTMFQAYRQNPQYKDRSDGEILQALINQHIRSGTPGSGLRGFMGFGTASSPAQYK